MKFIVPLEEATRAQDVTLLVRPCKLAILAPPPSSRVQQSLQESGAAPCQRLDAEGLCPLILCNVVHDVLVMNAGSFPLPSFSRPGQWARSLGDLRGLSDLPLSRLVKWGHVCKLAVSLLEQALSLSLGAICGACKSHQQGRCNLDVRLSARIVADEAHPLDEKSPCWLTCSPTPQALY